MRSDRLLAWHAGAYLTLESGRVCVHQAPEFSVGNIGDGSATRLVHVSMQVRNRGMKTSCGDAVSTIVSWVVARLRGDHAAVEGEPVSIPFHLIP